MKKAPFIVFIAAVSALGLISSDLYLPAFPALATEFQAIPRSVQESLSVFLLALSFSQLIYGVGSEIVGRRKMLLVGLVLYILGSVVCSLALSLPILILGRLIQGLGACAGLVLGRTIISDLYSAQDSASMIAIVFPIVALSPAIAPVLGSFFLQYFSWRFLFLGLTFFGATLLTLTYFKIPESKQGLSSKPVKPALIMGSVFKSFRVIFSDREFLAYALAVVGAYSAYFVYLTEAPFLFQQSHVSVSRTAFIFAPISLSYVFSTLYARTRVKVWSLQAIVSRGCQIIVCGGILIVIASLIHSDTALVFSMSILTVGNGFILSFATAAALAKQAERRGIASGALGTLQLGGASLASVIMGIIRNGTALHMGLWILACALFGASSFWYFSRRLVQNDH